MRELDRYPAGVSPVKAFKDGTGIVECQHEVPPEGVICGFCRASTDEERPVKVIVVLPKAEQEVLF